MFGPPGDPFPATSYPESPKFLSSSVDLLELATLFCLYVVNNIPLAFIASTAFVAFAMFNAFGMLPLATIHDAACCDVDPIIS